MENNVSRIILSVLASIAIMGLAAYYGFAGTRAYMNGELSMKHSLLENDCEKCHSPWKGVSAESCSSCHKGKIHHAAKDPAKVDAFNEKQITCLACHEEHKGKRHDLKAVGSGVCRNCHEFKEHPEIKELKKDAAAVKSILFPHQLHLENEAFAAVSCDACHLKHEDGERFINAKFEKTCVMCHELVKHGRDAEDKKKCPACHLHEKYDSTHRREPVITKALFSHKNHGASQCVDCHEDTAKGGDVADLKLPSVAKCQGCHEKNLMYNDCGSCHRFHSQEHGKSNKKELIHEKT